MADAVSNIFDFTQRPEENGIGVADFNGAVNFFSSSFSRYVSTAPTVTMDGAQLAGNSLYGSHVAAAVAGQAKLNFGLAANFVPATPTTTSFSFVRPAPAPVASGPSAR